MSADICSDTREEAALNVAEDFLAALNVADFLMIVSVSCLAAAAAGVALGAFRFFRVWALLVLVSFCFYMPILLHLHNQCHILRLVFF